MSYFQDVAWSILFFYFENITDSVGRVTQLFKIGRRQRADLIHNY